MIARADEETQRSFIEFFVANIRNYNTRIAYAQAVGRFLAWREARGVGLEQARRLGASEAELLRAYPSLRAEDLTHAWAYVRTHREEIERQIRSNEDV